MPTSILRSRGCPGSPPSPTPPPPPFCTPLSLSHDGAEEEDAVLKQEYFYLVNLQTANISDDIFCRFSPFSYDYIVCMHTYVGVRACVCERVYVFWRVRACVSTFRYHYYIPFYPSPLFLHSSYPQITLKSLNPTPFAILVWCDLTRAVLTSLIHQSHSWPSS